MKPGKDKPSGSDNALAILLPAPFIISFKAPSQLLHVLFIISFTVLFAVLFAGGLQAALAF
ncbi:MAG: hypothetical protein IPI63_11980 [Methanothrix sp.]|uniref:hypothetical protein n=1 Tax=Methanothrix sp. TaxID=90426 RepID=UPI001BD6A1B9|nr:hypothetical protein [Methanothrix sp.]MBK7387376.1 hypothetical protein [Methanothrix sp.]HPW72548.1 hypothetical protein [Methanothrix sp.]